MRDYEIVYVIRPDLSDEARVAKVERVHSLITENGGEIGKVDDWGKRISHTRSVTSPKATTD